MKSILITLYSKAMIISSDISDYSDLLAKSQNLKSMESIIISLNKLY